MTDEVRALEALVEAHWADCYRAARAVTRDPASAEDAAQEALVELLAVTREGRAPAGAGPWLRAVAINRARMRARSDARRSARDARAARSERASAGGPVDPTAELRELTGALPERLRLPLELHFGLGYTHAEVGQALGCPTGTAASRIRLGLERVRARLTRAPAAALPSLLSAALGDGPGSAPRAPRPADLLGRPRPAPPSLPRPRVVGRAAAVALAVLLPALVGGALLLDEAPPAGGAPPPSSPVAGVVTATAPGGSASPSESAGRPSGLPPVAGAAEAVAGAGEAAVTSGGEAGGTMEQAIVGARLPVGQSWQDEARTGGFGLSPDGRFAVTGAPDGLRLWDLGRPEASTRVGGAALGVELDERSKRLTVVGFVDAATCLVLVAAPGGVEQTPVLVRVPGGQVARRLDPERLKERGPFVPLGDGRLLLFGPCEVWDVGTGLRTAIAGVAGRVGVAAVSDDRQALAALDALGGDDDPVVLRRWRRRPDGWEQLPPRTLGEAGWGTATRFASAGLAFSTDGASLHLGVSGGGTHLLSTCSTATGEELARLRGGAVRLRVTSQGDLVVADREGVRVLEAASGRERLRLALPRSGEDTALVDLGVAPDGRRLVTLCCDDTVRVFDLADGRELSPRDHAEPVERVVVSPDGRTAVAAHRRGALSCWDAASGQFLHVVPDLHLPPEREEEEPDVTDVMDEPPVARSWELGFLADGTLGVVLRPSAAEPTARLAIVDARAGKVLRQRPLTAPDAPPLRAVAFAPGGRFLAVSDAKRARVLTLPALDPVGPPVEGGWVLALTADGSRLAVRRRGTAHVFDVPRGERLVVVEAEAPGPLGALCFDATGQLLLGVQPYRPSRLTAWELPSGRRRWRVDGLGAPLALSADGARVFASRRFEEEGAPAATVHWTLVGAIDLRDGVTRAWLRGPASYQEIRGLAPTLDGRRLFGASLEVGSFSEGPLVRWDLAPPR